ncbi:MAG: oxidoreductase [Rhodopirellula sp.]|nr:oxidoreductase [Rhodopirellula sp.]
MAASDSSEASSDHAASEASELAQDASVHASGAEAQKAGDQAVRQPSDQQVQSELGDAQEGSGSPVKRPRNRGRRAIIAACFAVLGAGYLQWNATATDHQFSNMGTVLVCFVLGCYILFQLHCLARMRWNGLVVPLASVFGIVVAVTLFRFEGFSGELVPQYAYRFGSPPPAMRTVEDSSKGQLGVEAVDGAGRVFMAGSQTADAPSYGFLGGDRTGVISTRDFEVPASVNEVQTLWRQGLGAGWSAFAVSGDRAVTLEQRGDQECLACYRLADGELVWMVTHEALHQHLMGGVGPRSTPTIVGNRVFAQGATGMVWCVELDSGQVVWSVDLLALAGWEQVESEEMISWGRAASPLIIDGTICVIPFGGPAANSETGRSLIALNAGSGEVLWTAGEDQISYASPALLNLGGKRQIVSVNERSITGHEVDDGRVLWEAAWPGQSNGGANCAMVVPAGENRFLIGKGYGGGSGLYEVTKSEGQWDANELWKSSRVLKTKFTHAAVVGDTAFAISNGSLEAVGVSEGERFWIQPRRTRLGQGQILVAGDVIIGQAEAGEVVLVAADPDAYRELLRLPALNAKTWNVPTLAGRHLLVRNDREVICFLLPDLEKQLVN